MRHRTAVMGILNVTPDSFSDGGRYPDVGSAVARGVEMVRQGANIVDVGGESTRPGAAEVSVADELHRVLPVIRGLRQRVSVPISIDTTKEEVARRALDAGADMVNDISALRFDPAMVRLVARENVPVVLMHMRGRPRTMQVAPRYRDVVREVTLFLRERVAHAVASGVAIERIVVDPGVGFGKNLDHNLALLRHLRTLGSLGRPVLVGLSRKSFLGRLEEPAGSAHPPAGTDGRLAGSLAGAAAAVLAGAHMVRVHDVLETCRAVRVADAIRDAGLAGC
jgi:dihydropteroate synthase